MLVFGDSQLFFCSKPWVINTVISDKCCLIPSTSASVKSYQLVKVVSGGRAPGKKFNFGITTTFSN